MCTNMTIFKQPNVLGLLASALINFPDDASRLAYILAALVRGSLLCYSSLTCDSKNSQQDRFGETESGGENFDETVWAEKGGLHLATSYPTTPLETPTNPLSCAVIIIAS